MTSHWNWWVYNCCQLHFSNSTGSDLINLIQTTCLSTKGDNLTVTNNDKGYMGLKWKQWECKASEDESVKHFIHCNLNWRNNQKLHVVKVVPI